MYLQTIHLTPAVYSRQPLLSARWKILLLNSLREPHRPQTQSLHCLSSGWTRAAGGRWSPQFSQEKGRARAELFPKKRLTMNAPHSFENRARVLSAQRISHVCHLLSETLTRIGTPPKRFIILILQKQSPLKEKKRMMCSTGALLCSQMLISLRHRRPPANVKCIGCLYSCFKTPVTLKVFP